MEVASFETGLIFKVNPCWIAMALQRRISSADSKDVSRGHYQPTKISIGLTGFVSFYLVKLVTLPVKEPLRFQKQSLSNPSSVLTEIQSHFLLFLRDTEKWFQDLEVDHVLLLGVRFEM